MKTVLLTLAALTLSLNAFAGDYGSQPEGQALLKQLRTSPAVKGALAQISQFKAKHKSCSGLEINYMNSEKFTVTASCNGSDGPSETEWAEIVTIEGSIYDAKTIHVDMITFNVAG